MAIDYNQVVIDVKNVTKTFKVYLDKGRTLKEFAIFSRRRKFENRVVLDDISFQIKKGETVALIGHNGCGKSTTLKLLTKIMYPDSGSITMQGRISSLIELGAGFHPDMSGRENIYINASIFGLSKAEIDEKIESIIEFSELQKFIDNPVRTYSSGMYMRLAFAVAINVNADILLIDEILAVGDANFQAKCFTKMQELKAQGVTIVIVTHDTGTVKTFCDRVIWIQSGKIREDGKAFDVVDSYLRYMNEEQIRKANMIRDEENQENSKEEVITMDPNAKHFGNQKAIIKKCTLLNSAKEETKAIKSDEKYYLKFDYEIKFPVEDLIFGMGIYSLDKTWIFGTNSQMAGFKFDVNGKKEGSVIFESEPLNFLQTGVYILQVSIIENEKSPCDYYNEYMRFTVTSDKSELGIIYYKTKWSEIE